jgi:CDP-glycerol glycerophosphotransferase
VPQSTTPIAAAEKPLGRGAKLLRRVVNLVTTAGRASKYEVYAFWRRRPVRQNVVFYESFSGNGVLCNPEAIFRRLLDDPEFAGLTHVWSLRSRSENRSVVREFASDRRVRFVRPNSSGYYRALATSGYLVNNATFPPEFGKRPGQVYLNTWHGTPLKRMGYDIGDPASRVSNVVRNFLAADFLLAGNRFTVDQMYESAHLLHEVFAGRYIETGYPRIDRQFLDDAAKADARSRLERAGVALGDREVLLYAPTWKGTNFSEPEDDIDELVARVVRLESLIDTERYAVVLKTHQVVHKFASHIPQLAGRLAPNEIPTNMILGVTDILVTDYSSIFFDFLATDRPIFFLTPDIADYSGYRGLYMEPETWPGPVTTSVEELAREISALDTVGRSRDILDNYATMRSTFTPYEDGGAAARVVDIVFRANSDVESVYRTPSLGKKKVLVNAGRFMPNGISASLLNLFEHIDYSRFDVTVVFTNSRMPLILENQSRVNPQVRQIARVGGMNGSKFAHLFRRLAWRRGDLRSHQTSPLQRRLWDDEFTRCFGATTFDFGVDFSGYGPFWAMLMLHARGAVHSIWMHNDLAADAHRTVGGKKRLLRNFEGIFTLYAEYQHLVSVSPSLAEVNRRSLSEFAAAEKFESAVNLVNADGVRAGAVVPLRISALDVVTGTLPAWANDLLDRPDITTFVSVGRLSPEKNHARLIRAFARIHAAAPATRLVIVGNGALLADLTALIEQLGLAGSTFLTGHQVNPHAVMAAADCFVLSSDYEGQPMVILEAMLLALPVVTVAFGSVTDAFPQGGGYIVEASDDGLVEGMTAFLDGRVSAPAFDPESYNDSAVDQFYRAIGAETVTVDIPEVS